MLEFCLDTGDFEMVKTASSIYPVNCFSMNPSIAVNCLKEFFGKEAGSMPDEEPEWSELGRKNCGVEAPETK